MKKWRVKYKLEIKDKGPGTDTILKVLLENRGVKTKKDVEQFLHPPDPYTLTPKEVGIDTKDLEKAIKRIQKAIAGKESIVVYTDYDADGITAGTVMWETLYSLGARVMPYVPHRVEEGYGLSIKGIDNAKKEHDPTLIITVDHGITAWEKVAYAKSLGIDVIITDHHVKPEKLPDCVIVHTTELSGSGVSWFVAKELLSRQSAVGSEQKKELLAVACIGTIADMVPLLGPNRSIVKYGLEYINSIDRVGLDALIADAGLIKGGITTYHISHMLAPRLNAMGRLVHALDAVRLLCTKNADKALELAKLLGETNRERQQMTEETTFAAMELVVSNEKSFDFPSTKLRAGAQDKPLKKLLFISHAQYNLGVIGLVAGKLVERFYLPAIVVAKGATHSKASARSIKGFNIIEAIRKCSDILVDAGGHPMAAGFTVETSKLELLQNRLEDIADKEITAQQLTRELRVDMELPFSILSLELFDALQQLEPFGVANPTPVFATQGVKIVDARVVGKEGKHLKLVVGSANNVTLRHSSGQTMQQFDNDHIDVIGFGMGDIYSQLAPQQKIDIAYSLDKNTWNGNEKLQLKLNDILL